MHSSPSLAFAGYLHFTPELTPKKDLNVIGVTRFLLQKVFEINKRRINFIVVEGPRIDRPNNQLRCTLYFFDFISLLLP